MAESAFLSLAVRSAASGEPSETPSHCKSGSWGNMALRIADDKGWMGVGGLGLLGGWVVGGWVGGWGRGGSGSGSGPGPG